MKVRRKDYTGQKFGKLTAISFAYTKNSKTYWNMQCECGNTKICRIDQAVTGDVTHCGCTPPERPKKHGKYKTRLAQIYYDMRQRCLNTHHTFYKQYGGRGISICKDWLGKSGSINFISWALNNGYKDNLTIDRIDVNGDYSPQNCRWTDKCTQSANRRCNGGVDFSKRANKWRVRIRYKNKSLFCKYFITQKEAIQARNDFIKSNNLPNFVYEV